MKDVTIAGLARAGGVGVETIRYYQRRGLLAVPRASGANGGKGVRRYGAADLRKLKFIRNAQTAGFTLDEIGELLKLDDTNERKKASRLARTRIAALDMKIEEMTRARDALSKLADACEHRGPGKCPIITSFETVF
jgi:MerR family mercuric resistance operon transcriptional regulator